MNAVESTRHVMKAYLKVVRDDLKDAEDWCRTAEMFKQHGDTKVATWFLTKAKDRIYKDFDIDWKKLCEVMGDGMTHDNTNLKESVCWGVMYEEYTEWHHRVKTMIDSMVM